MDWEFIAGYFNRFEGEGKASTLDHNSPGKIDQLKLESIPDV